MMRRLLLWTLLLPLFCVGFGQEGRAAPTCRASANPMAFGTLQYFQNNSPDATGTVTVTCDGFVRGAMFTPDYSNYRALVCFGFLNKTGYIVNSGNPSIQMPFIMDNSKSGLTLFALSDFPISQVISPTNGSGSANFVVTGRFKKTSDFIFSGSLSGAYYYNFYWYAYSGTTPPSCQTGSPFAQYQTYAVQVSVTGTMSAGCFIQTAPLDFGTQTTFATDATQTGTFTVKCTTSNPYYVTLDNGSNPSGSQRQMKFGANNYIKYDLYFTNSGSLQPWNASSYPPPAAGNNILGTSITITGKIPKAQFPTLPVPGTYMDVVTATINF